MPSSDTHTAINGVKESDLPLKRAEELEDLINAARDLIVPLIKSADGAAPSKATGFGKAGVAGFAENGLVDLHKPEELVELMKFKLPMGEGMGRKGLLETIHNVLKYSVNTWDQGFMDKLYSASNPVGVISEMLLPVINTNVHVYHSSPALTIVEKYSAKAFAGLFGFDGPNAGGFATAGGSTSNLTAIIIARNTLHPETKMDGNGDKKFIILTSAHGHYSLEKAAQICGLGSRGVWSVPVDDEGRMIPDELDKQIVKAKSEGKTPFFVNATAGTTVMGSYDPLREISAVCKKHELWMHIDASWGGPAIFSEKLRWKMDGSELADSLTINPHKMMNVPLSCSFLLAPDTAIMHRANTLPAGYLFHGDGAPGGQTWDLADLTLQCGRRGDALKLALSWIYYGAKGYERHVNHAFDLAAHLATVIENHRDFHLLSTNPPPCLQVCFYYAPRGVLSDDEALNTRRTTTMAAKLVHRGYMIDYAPGPRGSFFRAVVNTQTLRGTVDGLVKALEEIAAEQ